MTDSRDEYRKEWSAEMRAAAAEDDAASSEKWNQGCDFAMTQLCTLLGVDPRMVNWDAATETVDGDVQAVIGNIFLVKFGEDWADRLCASLAAPRPAAPLGGREEIAAFLLARDEMTSAPVPDDLLEWGRGQIRTGKNAEHDGDCTNKCYACHRCIADRALRDADAILALGKETGR